MPAPAAKFCDVGCRVNTHAGGAAASWLTLNVALDDPPVTVIVVCRGVVTVFGATENETVVALVDVTVTHVWPLATDAVQAQPVCVVTVN